jgi:outer membrane protein OmpA-like peptidoglycan-associated protein
MRGVLRTALVLLLLVQGCSTTRTLRDNARVPWDKPWTWRTGVTAAVCAVVGAGAGIGIQEGRTACATDRQDGMIVSQNCQSLNDPGDSTYWVWGALIGAVVGGVACTLLGHVLLDPAPEEPPPPPPPPPTPEPTPEPRPTIKQRIVMRGVNFAFNSAELEAAAVPVLDQAAEILKANPGVFVSVEGYTDSIGSEEYNQALSVRRAESVYRYLVNRGVDPERCQVKGFGESNPVASNDTETGRAQNRRVELVPEQR